ncbi:MAG TPA: hypothetical protein VNG51_09315 [Ktedonobacteraceae bacterium]|nr:hypothetical protein [Ktedonobacteraceae bacterium]
MRERTPARGPAAHHHSTVPTMYEDYWHRHIVGTAVVRREVGSLAGVRPPIPALLECPMC